MARTATTENQPASNVAEVLPQLASLWQQGELCDVCLRASDGLEFTAHKVLLAAASPYWSAVFVGAGRHMQGGSCKRRKTPEGLLILEVVDIDSGTLQLILQAIYGQPYEVTEDNVDALLAASNFLEVACVQAACCMHLQRKLSLTTCWRTLAAAVRFCCEALCEEAMTFIQLRFAELMAPPAQSLLQALPKHILLDLLHSPAITFNEPAFFQVALTWVAGNDKERLPHLPEVLAAVRLSTGANKPRKTSAWAISASDQAVQDAMREAGAIPALVHLLQHGRSEHVADVTSMLWEAIVNNDASKAALVETGGLAPLVYQLQAAADSCIHANALHTLCVINPANKEAIVAAGGVPVLLELLNEAPKVQSSAADCLGGLCYGGHAASQAAAQEAGAVTGLDLCEHQPVLAQFYRDRIQADESWARLYDQTLEALVRGSASLCTQSAANRQAFKTAGAEQALQQLMASGATAALREQATAALAALACAATPDG
ncbi:hypothetical protein WJX72_008357 [[Myrmecia] bisecta]|uniref:BTB domain-containing protein n=1 Tax=[Myrmecia] bisecta TaxID=41462 RepID=A0AAW1PFP1_9CHLO